MDNRTNDTIEPLDDRDEQLELYALGLLDERETAAVERLLREDPAARQRARELREVVSVLAFDADPVEPSPGLRARILDAARADMAPETAEREPEPVPAPATVQEPAPPISLAERRDGSMARWTPWLVAAALAVALATSLIWNSQLRSELDSQPDTATFAVAGSGPAENVAGTLVVVGDHDSGILFLAGLEELPADRAYQVWLIDDGDPVPNVTFLPNQEGVATVSVSGEISEYRVLAITVEPLAGSPAPTTEPIITSDLTSTT